MYGGIKIIKFQCVNELFKCYNFLSNDKLYKYFSASSSLAQLKLGKNVPNIKKALIKGKKKLPDGPNLQDFIDKWSDNATDKLKNLKKFDFKSLSHPYIKVEDLSGEGKKVYFKRYGCQMNFNDADIAWGILKKYGYELSENESDADIILIVTCSIREKAEEKIWQELKRLQKYRFKHLRKVGILGCMAERLKSKLLEDSRIVDIVAGPDSYKDLPRLISITDYGDKTVNVLLSQEETYADVTPVQVAPDNVSAFVSIMRGCDNFCTYCIVPFTRGVERSRDVDSIIQEAKHLSDSGIKQITLLGQNVNSYRDLSKCNNSESVPNAKGFNTIYKTKVGGIRFAELLDKVSLVDPEMRIRFTSPHPKDFSDEVLHIMKERPNICNNIHMPIQSGNSRVLEMMRRGYTREAYLELIDHIRTIIPDMTFSSDFICGFCSETEEEFKDTMSVVSAVPYTTCFTFAYSLREKTPADRMFKDDVPEDEKLRRLRELITVCDEQIEKVLAKDLGKHQLLLMEGTDKKGEMYGRNDANIKVHIPIGKLPENDAEPRIPKAGDYVDAVIKDTFAHSMKADPIKITTLAEFYS